MLSIWILKRLKLCLYLNIKLGRKSLISLTQSFTGSCTVQVIPFILCFILSLQENVKTTEELSKILESTRDHLESQLSRAETEKRHLNAQIQVCEHKENTEKHTHQHITLTV